MKKTLIIALSCLVVLFAACKKKPVEPTPVDYTANYVGNYMGQFTLTITSMNNSAVSNMSFPIDSIKMDIAKGTETARPALLIQFGPKDGGIQSRERHLEHCRLLYRQGDSGNHGTGTDFRRSVGHLKRKTIKTIT